MKKILLLVVIIVAVLTTSCNGNRVPKDIPDMKIYEFMSKNCGKMSIDSLNAKLNQKFLSKYDEHNIVKVVGVLTYVHNDSVVVSTESEIWKTMYNEPVGTIRYRDDDSGEEYIFQIYK